MHAKRDAGSYLCALGFLADEPGCGVGDLEAKPDGEWEVGQHPGNFLPADFWSAMEPDISGWPVRPESGPGVFTLLASIRRLALQNPKLIKKSCFVPSRAPCSKLQPIPDPEGASIGFLAVLHTWGQNRHLHPPLHCIVPAGGVSLDGSRWMGCHKSSFFLPVRLLSRRFRKSFLRSTSLPPGRASLFRPTGISVADRRLPGFMRQGRSHRLGGCVKPWKRLARQKAGILPGVPPVPSTVIKRRTRAVKS